MEHRTDSSSASAHTQSHGCLVALVLFTALLAAFACSPAPYRPVTGKPRTPAGPSPNDDDPLNLRVPKGAIPQGRVRGVSHHGPKPMPGLEDYYVGDYQIQVVHRIDHCDLLVGTDPWCFRYFPTVKAAKSRGYRACDHCIYSDYR